MNLQENKQAIIFCRVSSKEQEETGYSLPAQEKYLKEYCSRQDIRVAKIFKISESASGEKQRNKFEEMMEFINKREIKIIVCEKADRLTRNFKDMVAIDEWLEADDQREVHLVKDSLVMHQSSRSQEKLNWGIRILFAKNYIDNLSEEVKKGQKAKIDEGWFPRPAPLGYKTIGEKGHKIHVIDEDVAPYIKKMFEMYGTGNYSLKKIVDDLYEKGLRSKKGNKVGKSTIHRLLADPFYYGRFKWKDKEYPGKHDPLITKELYMAVQRIMTRPIKAPRYRKHTPVFKGKIRCGECKGTVTWERQKGHWYGHCNRYKPCSQKKYVRQDDIEKQIASLIEEVAIRDEEMLNWLNKTLKEINNDHHDLSDTAIKQVQAELEKVNNRMSNLYDDKVDGTITASFYQAKFEEYEEQKNDLVEHLSKLEHSGTDFYHKAVRVHTLAHSAHKTFLRDKSSVEHKREILSSVFSNFELFDGKLSEKFTDEFQFFRKWAKPLNETFELEKTRLIKGKTGLSQPARSVLLSEQDSNL